jgi:hypothetical protein
MRMTHVLAGAVAVAGALAFFGGGFRSTQTPAPVAETAAWNPAPGAGQEPAAGQEPGGAVLQGEVLETLDVPGYTYIRMGQEGTVGEWVAVSTAQVKVGERVTFRGETVMTDFESPTLKRRFSTIRFGVLDGAGSARGAQDPHGSTGAGSDMAGAPPGHPSAMPAAAGTDVPVGKVDKAEGPNGRRIAEIFAQKATLSGKLVRVRGVVVKATSGVMGKNFIHLRDGSGSEDKKNNDLTVTTGEALERGQTVLIEGHVTVDKDLGAGYRYDVLIEDAHSVK